MIEISVIKIGISEIMFCVFLMYGLMCNFIMIGDRMLREVSDPLGGLPKAQHSAMSACKDQVGLLLCETYVKPDSS